MSIFNFNKLPKAFLLAVFLAVIFEGVIWRLDQNYLLSEATEGLRIKIKNRLSQAHGSRFDIIILGDCYLHLGLQPKIIEDKTGLKCFNFSTYVWQTDLSSYAFLRNYLKNSPKPKLIIISFNSWGAMFSKQDIIQERIPYFYEFTEGNHDILIKEFGLMQGIKFLIPSLAKQDVLQKILQTPFQTSLFNRKPLNEFIDNVYAERGFDPSYMDKPYNYWRLNTQKLPLSPFFVKYLISILELAKNNNIPVLYIKPTLPKTYFSFEEKQYHTSEAYDNFISFLASRYSNMTVWDLQNILNDANYYQSKQHLNRKGSLILSEYTATKLKSLAIFK